MSAILALKHNGQIAILTDGAICDRRARLVEVTRKVRTSAKLPFIVASRGDRCYGEMVSEIIIDLVEKAGFDVGMRALAELAPNFAPKRLPHDIAEIYVAGLSETEGPQHRFLVNTPNFGVQPLQLIDPGKTFFATVHMEEGEETFENIGVRPPTATELAGRYFVETGARWMEFYRGKLGRSSYRANEDVPAFRIGGQVDLTMIDQLGVTSYTIHTWPDRIGEKINPHAGKSNVTPLYTGRPTPSHPARECEVA